MKKTIFVSLLMILCLHAYTQVPQGINYQAIVYNNSGHPLSNTDIQVRAGILSDTLTPFIVWEELHSKVKTDANGLFSLVIGTGERQSGSALTFGDIRWTNSPLFIRIQINYQGGWKNFGAAKLWTVPYAMAAGDVTGKLKKLTVTGETDDTEEALFEVKNKKGQTVFAVFNEGVRIYVDNSSKGAKGGFAIGSFDTSKDGSQNLLYVDSDSIRAYIDMESEKGVKGGFAIGGFSNSKGLPTGYMFINPDSTRFYVRKRGNDNSSTFNIIGINADNTLKPLLTASTDTVGIGTTLNVRGNITYTGVVASLLPEIYTSEFYNITNNSATLDFEIISDGGSPITSSGVVWSTKENPTVDLATKTTDGGTEPGYYSSVITGLTASTTYYARPYATNVNGTGYGQQVIFTTTVEILP